MKRLLTPALFFFLIFLSLIAYYLYASSSSDLAPIVKSPSKPLRTPSPTLSSRFNAPDRVDYSQLPTGVSLPDQFSVFSFQSPLITESAASPFLSAYNLTQPPNKIDTQETSLTTWSSSTYYLTINHKESTLDFGKLNPKNITRSGRFDSVDSLTAKALQLLKNTNLFDQQLIFKLENTEYFVVGPEYLDIASPASAHLVTLTFTPYLDNSPLYLQEKFFYQVSFDRGSDITKLNINHPITAIKKTSTVKVFAVEEVRQKPSSDFFRLFVKPKNDTEYFLQAPDITNLQPNQLTPAYLVDLNSSLLQPIYTFSKRTDSQIDYLYAVFAAKNSP
ncbi:hypothetical protein HY333_01420 [Candidatus Collierbacteria bacterium]|nr:hypothetical protein [Candidatus Collierbacteria bacterium]